MTPSELYSRYRPHLLVWLACVDRDDQVLAYLPETEVSIDSLGQYHIATGGEAIVIAEGVVYSILVMNRSAVVLGGNVRFTVRIVEGSSLVINDIRMHTETQSCYAEDPSRGIFSNVLMATVDVTTMDGERSTIPIGATLGLSDNEQALIDEKVAAVLEQPPAVVYEEKPRQVKVRRKEKNVAEVVVAISDDGIASLVTICIARTIAEYDWIKEWFDCGNEDGVFEDEFPGLYSCGVSILSSRSYEGEWDADLGFDELKPLFVLPLVQTVIEKEDEEKPEPDHFFDTSPL